MNSYAVIRGEYPFEEVLGVVVGESPEAALADATEQNKNSTDVFVRHPVVELL
jgi:TctA family transporter